jgi:hypothetical protein
LSPQALEDGVSLVCRGVLDWTPQGAIGALRQLLRRQRLDRAAVDPLLCASRARTKGRARRATVRLNDGPGTDGFLRINSGRRSSSHIGKGARYITNRGWTREAKPPRPHAKGIVMTKIIVIAAAVIGPRACSRAGSGATGATRVKPPPRRRPRSRTRRRARLAPGRLTSPNAVPPDHKAEGNSPALKMDSGAEKKSPTAK